MFAHAQKESINCSSYFIFSLVQGIKIVYNECLVVYEWCPRITLKIFNWVLMIFPSKVRFNLAQAKYE